MKKIVMPVSLAVLAAGFFWAKGAMAVDLPGPASIDVTAIVPSNLTFSVTVCQIVAGTPVTFTSCGSSTPMNFGNLASQGTFDPDGTGPLPPQPRALSSTKAFQVFFGVNAQGRAFTVKQTAGHLVSGSNTVPDGAFIVTPLDGIGGDNTKPLPSGISKGTRGTAVFSNKALFTSTGGLSDTMAATYGITDDPNLGATQPIPLDQPAGTYTTTVTFTATVT